MSNEATKIETLCDQLMEEIEESVKSNKVTKEYKDYVSSLRTQFLFQKNLNEEKEKLLGSMIISLYGVRNYLQENQKDTNVLNVVFKRFFGGNSLMDKINAILFKKRPEINNRSFDDIIQTQKNNLNNFTTIVAPVGVNGMLIDIPINEREQFTRKDLLGAVLMKTEVVKSLAKNIMNEPDGQNSMYESENSVSGVSDLKNRDRSEKLEKAMKGYFKKLDVDFIRENYRDAGGNSDKKNSIRDEQINLLQSVINTLSKDENLAPNAKASILLGVFENIEQQLEKDKRSSKLFYVVHEAHEALIRTIENTIEQSNPTSKRQEEVMWYLQENGLLDTNRKGVQAFQKAAENVESKRKSADNIESAQQHKADNRRRI